MTYWGARLGGASAKKDASKRYQSNNIINFFDDDLQEIQIPDDDLVVILAMIGNYNVKRILIDNGSSSKVLFYDAFVKAKTFLVVDQKKYQHHLSDSIQLDWG